MSDNYDDSTNIEDDALFDEELLEDYDFTDDLELSTNKNTIHDTIGNVTNITDGPKAIPTAGKFNKKLKYRKEANKKEELPTKTNKGKNPLENKPEVQKGRMNPVSVQRNKTSATESTSGNKQKNKASDAAKFYEDIFDDNQIKKAELDNSLAYSDVIKTQEEVTKPTQTTTPQPISENKTTANKVNKPQVSKSVPNKNVQNETMKQTKKTTNEPQTPKAGVPKSNVLKQIKITKKKATDAAYDFGRNRSNASRGLPSGVPRAFLMKQSNMNSIEPRAPHIDNNPTPQGSLIPLVDNTAVKAKQLENMMKKLNKKFNPANPVTQTYMPIEQHNVPNAPFYSMMDQYQPMTPEAQHYAQTNYGQNSNPQVYQPAPPMYGQAYNQSYTMPVAPVPPQNIPNPVLFQTPLDQHSLAQHAPLHVETATAGQSDPSPNYQPQERQLMYSPSDVYSDSKQDTSGEQEKRAGSETHEFTSQAGQKRLSAFQRLGPLTESAKVTKKPKLTINLLLKKEEDIREVLDGEINSQEHIPVYRRPDIINSKNAVVQKFLPFWPWKKNVSPKKTSSARVSKSAMIVELEQMEEIYLKDNIYFQITVKGYPETWTKERVMDTILNAVKGKSFIPCFIEFTKEQCIFLVIKSYSALVALHKMFFVISSKEVELKLSIGYLALNTNHLSFLPKLVLESIILSGYDSESKLSLKAFTMDEDVSHFIYYPLSRLANQVELIQSQRGITWTYITDLDLSGNRLTTLDGFDLSHNCPKLKHLNLSNNYFTRISNLLGIRSLPLRSITLEGNPLCHDYIDPDHYVMVLRTAFNTLREIDGIPVRMKGELPPCIRNYCPQESIDFVEQFLSVYFPLMDSPPEDRHLMENLYHENAVLTITYRENLRSQAVYRRFRNLLLRARVLSAGDVEAVRGAAGVARHLARAPPARHDLAASLDVMYHGEDAVVLKLTGIMKLTAETLAEDEHLIAYSRTFVFKTTDGVEYKIVNEMLYWDEPTPEYANNAFKFTMIKSKPISLKIEGTPDEDLKEKLVELFMKVTNLKEGPSYRCLEMKDWNFKLALQLFFKLLKLDNLSSLLSEKDPSP